MTEKQFVTHSPKETMALAERFAALLRPGDVVAYEGGMGAGKTVFTRGVARFFGVEDEVASPTFALVNEYGQDPVLAHFDLWRITDEDDLYSTGQSCWWSGAAGRGTPCRKTASPCGLRARGTREPSP